ncbi:hypothetical protein EV359DRAFT_62897 [Lentinula novae-zelandiae]|nr:hypothetical protein EV359DRAFT_62897 [Lentinula novae-zelandiae]
MFESDKVLSAEYSDQKIRPLLVRYFEEWHGLYSRWAPADLDDVAVGTPGSAARRHEKKTVAPYRSYEVKESMDMVSTPPTFESPTSDPEGKGETPRKRERYSARFLKVPSYRSFAVDEPTPTNLHATKNTKRAAFEDPPSPTTQCNKRVKISTNDSNLYDLTSGLKPLKKTLLTKEASKGVFQEGVDIIVWYLEVFHELETFCFDVAESMNTMYKHYCCFDNQTTAKGGKLSHYEEMTYLPA